VALTLPAGEMTDAPPETGDAAGRTGELGVADDARAGVDGLSVRGRSPARALKRLSWIASECRSTAATCVTATVGATAATAGAATRRSAAGRPATRAAAEGAPVRAPPLVTNHAADSAAAAAPNPTATARRTRRRRTRRRSPGTPARAGARTSPNVNSNQPPSPSHMPTTSE
jgi:hypothetical protein